MKLASWNVNSIRQRQSHIRDWLQKEHPDWLFLQEIKCETSIFPQEIFEELGYKAAVVGQKAYNGVAILSRHPFEILHKVLPGLKDEQPQARYIEIKSQDIILGNLYLPNGNSGGTAGYQAKLDFMNALADHVKDLLDQEQNCLFAGDYNVCPTDNDLSPGVLPPDDALVRYSTRANFRRLLWLGLSDALRVLYPEEKLYTFWDYTKGHWQRDQGLRIDHVLLSPRLTEQLKTVRIDREERAREQPSDHVPIVVEF